MKLAPGPQAARSDLVALGVATALAQALLLREAMAALGGSELAWGAVLALWLLGMAAGAAAGARHGRAAVASWGPAGVMVAALAGQVALRGWAVLSGAAPGETPSTWGLAGVGALAVLPAALLGGWAFPVLAGALEARRGAGSAYALESAGAVAGGAVFTLALTSWPAVGALSVVALGTFVAFRLLKRSRRLQAVLALAVAVAAAMPADELLARLGWRLSRRVGELAAWRETRQQRLELAAGVPAALYADGRLVGVFPDPYRSVARAHLVLLMHARPRRVLVIDGLSSGLLPALLRQGVERVDVVEDDPGAARVLPAWLGGELRAALADPRVVVHRAGLRRALGQGGLWDVVILADPDPTTLRLNRTRTVEGLRHLAEHLAPEGLVVMRVGVPDTYLGGAGGRLLGVLAATLRSVLPTVRGVPGEEILLVGSRENGAACLEPATLAARYRERGLLEPAFPPEAVEIALDPTRAAALDRFLREDTSASNRAERPEAVVPAVALQEGRGTAALLPAVGAAASLLRAWGPYGLAVGCLALVGSALRRRGPGLAVAIVTGGVSMSWWVLLMAAWQRAYGSVFTEVGALSAAFMLGMVGGAGSMRRWGGVMASSRRISNKIGGLL